MLDEGFVLLHRSLLKWEWYDDINTTRLFLHLLLTVNYEPKEWHGIVIERGQRAASFQKLATETGLSVKSIRTSLTKLKSTGEVAHTATSKYGVFTVKNYSQYQVDGSRPGSQGAVEGQPRGNNGINNKQSKKEKERDTYVSPKKKFTAPTVAEVRAYCLERCNGINPEHFVDFYEAKGWKIGKEPMKDWKAAVRTWEKNDRREDTSNAGTRGDAEGTRPAGKYGVYL